MPGQKSLTGFDANNKNVRNVADPSAATDAANKQYVDALVRGLSWKEEVKAAATGNINLAAPGATIDGVTMAATDRFLAPAQSTASQSGIYVWNGAATPATRALDADSTGELENAATFVAQGTVNADKAFVQSATITTVDTTAQVWSQFGGGTSVIGGNGLVLTGSTLDVGAGTGISVAADSVGIDTAVVARKGAANCAATTNPQSFPHGAGSADVDVAIREVATGILVGADITVDTTNITVDFGGAPSASQFRIIWRY